MLALKTEAPAHVTLHEHSLQRLAAGTLSVSRVLVSKSLTYS